MEFCTEDDGEAQARGAQFPGGVRRGFTGKRTFEPDLEGPVRICQAKREGADFKQKEKHGCRHNSIKERSIRQSSTVRVPRSQRLIITKVYFSCPPAGRAPAILNFAGHFGEGTPARSCTCT